MLKRLRRGVSLWNRISSPLKINDTTTHPDMQDVASFRMSFCLSKGTSLLSSRALINVDGIRRPSLTQITRREAALPTGCREPRIPSDSRDETDDNRTRCGGPITDPHGLRNFR